MEKPLLSKYFLWATTFLFFLFLTVFFQIYQENRSSKAGVFFFDVPGESILVMGKRGERILIDAGQTTETANKLLSLLPFWDRHIDLILLTHFDADHIGGAEEVLQNFEVRFLVTNGTIRDSEMAQNILSLAQKKNIPLFSLFEGKDIRLGDIFFDTAFPRNSLLGQKAKGNVDSLAGRMMISDVSIFFTGDLEEKGERALLFSPQKIQSTILKVGHHGSKTSSQEAFIASGAFDRAVIVASDPNPYHHPHPQTTNTFQKYHIPFQQTGKEGDIFLPLSTL